MCFRGACDKHKKTKIDICAHFWLCHSLLGQGSRAAIFHMKARSSTLTVIIVSLRRFAIHYWDNGNPFPNDWFFHPVCTTSSRGDETQNCHWDTKSVKIRAKVKSLQLSLNGFVWQDTCNLFNPNSYLIFIPMSISRLVFSGTGCQSATPEWISHSGRPLLIRII